MPAIAQTHVGMTWLLRSISSDFMTWYPFNHDRFHGMLKLLPIHTILHVSEPHSLLS